MSGSGWELKGMPPSMQLPTTVKLRDAHDRRARAYLREHTTGTAEGLAAWASLTYVQALGALERNAMQGKVIREEVDGVPNVYRMRP